MVRCWPISGVGVFWPKAFYLVNPGSPPRSLFGASNVCDCNIFARLSLCSVILGTF